MNDSPFPRNPLVSLHNAAKDLSETVAEILVFSGNTNELNSKIDMPTISKALSPIIAKKLYNYDLLGNYGFYSTKDYLDVEESLKNHEYMVTHNVKAIDLSVDNEYEWDDSWFLIMLFYLYRFEDRPLKCCTGTKEVLNLYRDRINSNSERCHELTSIVEHKLEYYALTGLNTIKEYLPKYFPYYDGSVIISKLKKAIFTPEDLAETKCALIFIIQFASHINYLACSGFFVKFKTISTSTLSELKDNPYYLAAGEIVYKANLHLISMLDVY